MHPMKRKALIVLLGLGTVLGYSGGFMSMRCHARARHARFEEHVAKICTNAAAEARDSRETRDSRDSREWRERRERREEREEREERGDDRR